MGTTAQTGLPYPAETDPASDGAYAIQLLAEALDKRPLGYIDGTSATDGGAPTVAGAERKDPTLRDVTVVVPAGAARCYEIKVTGRVESTAATTTADLLVRDGGAASPTTASAVVDGCAVSSRLETGVGAGAQEIVLTKDVTLTAGTHKLGVFYKRTSGAGEITLKQSTSGKRQITVTDKGLWVAP